MSNTNIWGTTYRVNRYGRHHYTYFKSLHTAEWAATQMAQKNGGEYWVVKIKRNGKSKRVHVAYSPTKLPAEDE